MYASYSYIVLPARPHGTDLDCVGKRKKSICWVSFQKKQTAESDESKVLFSQQWPQSYAGMD